VLLTVIAVNMTIMVGWGAAKVFVPEVRPYGAQDVRVVNTVDVDCDECLSESTFIRLGV
jgi:hypothetical protein